MSFDWPDSTGITQPGIMSVSLWPPALMGSGSYQDQIRVEFCPDAQCRTVLAELTKIITVQYEVTGTAPSNVTFNVTPSAGMVIEATDVDTAAAAKVSVYAADLPPYTTYIFARIQQTGAIANGNWSKDTNVSGYRSELTLNMTSPSTLAPGRYNDILTLSICYDQACTRPARGSPWSIPIRYTVTATAGKDYAQRMADARSNDIAWSSIRGRLYAVTAASSSQSPSSLIEIDPASSQVTRSLNLGGNPTVLSVTDDGSYAYVGFSDQGQVKRIALDSMVTDLAIPLPVDPTYGMTFAGYLLPVPGAPTSVVVSSYLSALGLTDWNSRGVYIYDGATARPQTFFTPQPNNRVMDLAWNTDNVTLYAYDQNMMRLSAATASAAGLTLASHKADVSMMPQMRYLNGMLYSNGGFVTDPSTGTRTASFLDSSAVSLALMAPDSNTGRAYFYYMEELTPASRWTFATFDLQTRTFIASTRVSDCSLFPGGVNINVGRLVRWGTDGLAVNCREGIKIINGKFVKP